MVLPRAGGWKLCLCLWKGPWWSLSRRQLPVTPCGPGPHIWCTDLIRSQTDNKDGLEAPQWTKLNTAGQMEINYKQYRRLWKSTPSLTHEHGWRQSSVRSVQVTPWLCFPFFTRYREGNSKHLRQWGRLRLLGHATEHSAEHIVPVQTNKMVPEEILSITFLIVRTSVVRSI